MSATAMHLSPLVLIDLMQRADALRDGPGWEAFHAGVDAQWLYGKGTDGSSAVLLRYQPGAKIPLHEHTGYEHVFVLEGEQSDEHGTYPAGSFVINPAGTSHRVFSATGCVALLIYEKPVRFLEVPAASAAAVDGRPGRTQLPGCFTLPELAAFYAIGGSPVKIAEAALARIAEWDDPSLFISRVAEQEVLRRARDLEAEGPRGRALFGAPFVIKDNIDAAGLSTTAGCPGYAYRPAENAPAVQRAIDAGAILLGKTNLDQFATGLVGTRTPYGPPRNAIDALCVPGGSSSGSSTAVSAGLVAFALGTDTAGSGRVPAAFNNIIGLKPSVGLVPTLGVVPACRSLDCVAVLALTVDDAATVLEAIAGTDAADPYSRPAPAGWRAKGTRLPSAWRLAIPHRFGRVFATSDDAALFDAAIDCARGLGASVEEVDLSPFLDVARRLYDGAWVAERTSALRGIVERRPDALNPITRSILEGGLKRMTIDAFDDFYAVAKAKLLMRDVFERVDALMLPTTPGIPTLEEVAKDPIGINSRNGTYTNFTNLLNLCGVAVPAGFRADGRPAGVTLMGKAFSEGLICAIAGALHSAQRPHLNLGASKIPVPKQ